MESQENVVNEHVSDSLDVNAVRSWWKGLSWMICGSGSQMRTAIPNACVAEDNNEDFDYMLLLKKTCIVMAKTDQENKNKLLSYIVETEPGLRTLITLLNNKNYHNMYMQLSIILRESVSPKNGNGNLRAVSVSHALTFSYLPFFMDILVDLHNKCNKHKEDSSPIEDILPMPSKQADSYVIAIINYLWFLSAVAQKDNKFAVKIGCMSKVKFLHELLQNVFFSRVSSHFPVLKILRKLSRNGKVSLILGKSKIMKTIKKMFSTIDKEPSLKSQMFLDIIVQLTKEKVNSRRFLQAGCLPSLLRCFQYFSLNWKGKPLYKLSKAVVAIYTQISRTKLGRKVLVQSEALSHLSQFCETCPNEKGFHLIISRSCTLIFLCYGAYKLPLSTMNSPARFSIPKVDHFDEITSINELSGESGESSGEDEGDDEGEGVGSNSDDSNSEEDSEEQGRYSFTDTETDEDQDEGGGDSEGEPEEKNINKINSAKRNSKTISPSKTVDLENNVQEVLEVANFYKEFEDLNENEHTTFPIFNRRNSRDRRTSIANNSEFRFSDFSNKGGLEGSFHRISNNARSVISFVKIAYPDLKLAFSTQNTELLNNPTEKITIRKKWLRLMSRVVGPEDFEAKVIYDIDEKILHSRSTSRSGSYKSKTNQHRRNSKVFREPLTNNDETEIDQFNENLPLAFESRFESGNLRKVIQVDTNEYDLLLMSDVNSNSHNQWFYFQISNIKEHIDYTLNIINCIKGSSQFNLGMQPVMFSVSDALAGKPGWVRCGKDICYFKNGYQNPSGKKTKPFYSVSFTLNFQNRGDIVYIAYHMPYTYSRLLTELDSLKRIVGMNQNILFRCDILCQTLNKNDVPLITVTSNNNYNGNSKIESRDLIFITSRVHPGETNASWIVQGLINKLLFDPNMECLLQRFVFKIVPMLNVEGVVNGCTRCGLTAEDLNRRWKTPSKILNPTIYYSKMLLNYFCKVKGKVPVLFCDFHGHSKKKNVFLYGCSYARSWSSEDRMKPEDPQAIHELPESISRKVPALSLSLCNYEVRQSRETTARVAVWRDFNVIRSYTLECSYCGCDEGSLSGVCFGTRNLLQIGEGFCEALNHLNNYGLMK